MPNPPYRLAYFVTHPIQYQAPLLKQLAAEPGVDLTVFFLSEVSTSAYHDRGFNKIVQWDVPLLEGYRHKFLPSQTRPGDFSLTNPKVKLAALRDALNSDTWDAVWVHGYGNLALLYVIWYASRKRIPLLFRGESNLCCSPRNFRKDLFIRWLVRHSAALLWIGSDNRDYYEFYGAQPGQLFFTPYAVNNDLFQSCVASSQDSSSPPKTVFLYASKFLARKHAPLLLQAFQEIPDSLRSNAELWYVGDGDDAAVLEHLIEEYDVGAQVKLLGFKNQSEMPQYLSRCDVFVLPSEKEPFGLIINEAMNLGKAIITTDEVGAARDLVEHGVNGWVVKAADRQALTEALQQAICDRAGLAKMGEVSLAKISGWSYQQDIEGIVAALASLGNAR